jgi:glycerol-3-phosphate dehydrogenase
MKRSHIWRRSLATSSKHINRYNADVCIIGGGMVGTALASALGMDGYMAIFNGID